MKSDRIIIIIAALFVILITAVVTIRYHSDSLLLDSTTDTYNSATLIDGRLNINTASKEELSMLPGIGNGLSKRIIEYRDKEGPFEDIEDLTKVKGIGKKLLDNIRQYITTDG